MYTLILLAGMTLGGATDAAECRNPPSRASDGYWDYIDACGCEKLVAPSKASSDYRRFMKACSAWRERNAPAAVVVSREPAAAASPSASECRNPPSRASESYWDYIDACGCASLDPPAWASDDYGRFMKACSDWRERNPGVEVVAPSPAPVQP